MNANEVTPVVSQPLKKIVGEGRNYKYVKNCLELHLGAEGIEVLQDFDKFENLEVLFLNDNKLKTIIGLEKNFRLRRLYLMGSLRIMNYLEHLDLSYNYLRNLKKVLDGLEHLRFLKQLNLSGNPCCEEPGYRIMVLSVITSLNVLDNKVVTDLERQVALSKNKKSSGNTSGNQSQSSGAVSCKTQASCLERLQREAKKILENQAKVAESTPPEDGTRSTKTKSSANKKDSTIARRKREKIDYLTLFSYRDLTYNTKWC